MHLAIVLLLALPAAAWRAYVTSILWVWFVTPAFGIVSPSLWILAGLSVLIGLYQNWNVKPLVKEDASAAAKSGISIAMALIGPAFCLGIGWVFHMLAIH